MKTLSYRRESNVTDATKALPGATTDPEADTRRIVRGTGTRAQRWTETTPAHRPQSANREKDVSGPVGRNPRYLPDAPDFPVDPVSLCGNGGGRRKGKIL